MTIPREPDSSSPLLIWTFRRTGGTNLGKSLFRAISNSCVEHEPFNPGRLYGEVTKKWLNRKDTEALGEALDEILAQQKSIKHCLEIIPDEINRQLLEISTKHGYKHLFLYRESAADRLLSLNFAMKSGVWGKKHETQKKLDEKIFLEKINSNKLIQHEQNCRRKMRFLYQMLLDLGVEPLAVSFEALYQAPYDYSKKLVKSLFDMVTDMQFERQDTFYRELLERGGQGTKTEYQRFTGSEDFLKLAGRMMPFRLYSKADYHMEKSSVGEDLKHFESWQLLPGARPQEYCFFGIVLDPSDSEPCLELRQGKKCIGVTSRMASEKMRKLYPDTKGSESCRFLTDFFITSRQMYFFKKDTRDSEILLAKLSFIMSQPLQVIRIENTRIGYYPIPKVACTSIKNAIYRIEHKNFFSVEENGCHIHRYYKKKKKKNILLDCEFSFIVIRDPIKRFLSGYSNRVTFHKELSRKKITATQPELLGLIIQFDPDIDEFIEQLNVYLKVRSISHHVKPISENLAKEQLLEFSEIYLLEELSKLESDLSDKLGQEVAFGHLQTGGEKVHLSSLNRKQMEILIDYYDQDYKLLENFYKPEDIWKEWAEKGGH